MIILDSMGHLYSDTSIQELYDFAVKKLKLKPQWNHYSRHFPHFDLTTKHKKDLAINLGALYVDARDDIYRHKRAQQIYKNFYEENKDKKYWYECKGLMGQKILRIDFNKLGIN